MPDKNYAAAECDFLWSRLEALFASLPTVQCQGKCQEGCGPIAFHEIEAENIRRRGFLLPMVTDHPELGPLTCSALGTRGKSRGRCTIYEARPLVCRLFGVARAMKCPWGCTPERIFERWEEEHVMSELRALSFAFCGHTGTRSTTTARQIEEFLKAAKASEKELPRAV